MFAFFLPKSWCKNIDQCFKNFFWGFKDDSKHLTPLAWSSICKPTELGGLELRRMFDINRSLIAKLGWIICTKPQSLWVQVLRAKYFRSAHSLADPIKTPQSSWIWEIILACRDILDKWLRFQVFRGTSIQLWLDP